MNKPITLLQITDCHLQETSQTEFKSFYPDQRLDAIIQDIEEQHLTVDKFDHLLLTGDLAHCAKDNVYQRLLEKTAHLADKSHWIAGNHDDVQVMQQFEQMQRKTVIQGNWAIVLLDSTSHPNGVGSGSLSQQELTFLSRADQLPVEHLLLVLHHPPIELGSAWQDEIKLANSDAFWQVVNKLQKVKAVTFGHLHQEHHLQLKGVELLCTPATAPQFKKLQKTPVLEVDRHLAAPGYRLLQLHFDGKLTTSVHRAL